MHRMNANLRHWVCKESVLTMPYNAYLYMLMHIFCVIIWCVLITWIPSSWNNCDHMTYDMHTIHCIRGSHNGVRHFILFFHRNAIISLCYNVAFVIFPFLFLFLFVYLMNLEFFFNQIERISTLEFRILHSHKTCIVYVNWKKGACFRFKLHRKLNAHSNLLISFAIDILNQLEECEIVSIVSIADINGVRLSIVFQIFHWIAAPNSECMKNIVAQHECDMSTSVSEPFSNINHRRINDNSS